MLHTLRRLKEQGFEIQLLDVGAEGNITAAQVEEAIRPDTCLGYGYCLPIMKLALFFL
mgnify:CR=1 FL=1